MSQPFSDHFSSHRAAAAETATAVLRAAGFSSVADRRWRGVTPKGHTVEIELPPPFPDQLPKVFRVGERHRHIAHVERSGKLCIAPVSGTLIDVARPDDIVRDVIARADDILSADGQSQQTEIEREFESYWGEELDGRFVSICPPARHTGPVYRLDLDAELDITIIASDPNTAWGWAHATGRKVIDQRQAFFVRLDRPPAPPSFHRAITLRDLLSLVKTAGSEGSAKALKDWLGRVGLPATVLLSAPLRDGGDVIVAAFIPALQGEIAAKAQHGFRPGKVPPRQIVAKAMSEPVHRLTVSRADPEFLLPRGGATVDLSTKKVALIGCGSVGSFTASALAASGVGHLVLVDGQKLRTENIHRHVLGAVHIGHAKVTALGKVLRSRFPHLEITEVASAVENNLDDPGSPVLAADLVVFALGEDNLELQLNKFLRGGPRRVHVWLDPLGVGGHVLRVGTENSPGCFECLFRSDPEHGMTNMASLVAPNQDFQRSLGGCAGTFTPFGAIDAERAGIEAAKEVIRCLSTASPKAMLTTWVVSRNAITDAGYRLSARGTSTSDDMTIRHGEFARADCPVCARVTP